MDERAAGGRIAVLGLGRMGLPVARRLAGLTPGWSVTVFDPVGDRQDAAAAAGLDVAPSGEVAARGADVVVLVLPGSAEVAGLVAGSAGSGILHLIGAGATVLDLSSTDPRVAERAAHAVAVRGAGWVGAPMGGGVEAAERGGLTLFVGGAPEVVSRVQPLLDALTDPARGGRVETAGPGAGDGCTAKLLVNALWFGQAAAVAEALLIGRSRGLDPAGLVELLGRSAVGGAFLDGYGQAVVDDDPLAVFGLDRVVEELEIVRGLAFDAGVDAPVAGMVARLHREALAEFGPVDGELLVARLLALRAARGVRPARGPRDQGD